MKTTAKWISGDQFVIDNNRYFQLAVTDPAMQGEMEPSCLDLILMGFTGCITSSFRRKAREKALPYPELDTEISLEFIKKPSDTMILKVIMDTSGTYREMLEDCLKEAVDSSLPGILLTNSGIHVQLRVKSHSTQKMYY